MNISIKSICVASIIVMGAFFMAQPELTASDQATKQQTLRQMKAETVDKPAPGEPSVLKEFRSKTHVPLDTEAELHKKRATLLAKNTQLKRKEFKRGARVRALSKDPSLSQLPDYQADTSHVAVEEEAETAEDSGESVAEEPAVA